MTNTNRAVRRIAAGMALLCALTSPTGCSAGGGDSTPAAAPTSSSPAPLPSQDWNRLACEALPTGWLELLDNLADTRRAAENALKSSDPVMQRHGMDLRDAVNTREAADLGGDQGAAVDANLDISRAALDMAEACSTLYGDGNW